MGGTSTWTGKGRKGVGGYEKAGVKLLTPASGAALGLGYSSMIGQDLSASTMLSSGYSKSMRSPRL
jgi:hypothetical protein